MWSGCRTVVYICYFVQRGSCCCMVSDLVCLKRDVMTEQTRSATPAEATVTLVESEEDIQQDVPTLRLRLRKPKPKKKVQWRSGTVDNEHLNKKKSKCCCQYEKPRQFGESSSDSDDDECENCHGHVERKRKKKQDNGSSSPLEDKDSAVPLDSEPSTSNSHQ